MLRQGTQRSVSDSGSLPDLVPQAHQAYSRGDGQRAHELSEEGKQHGAQMDAYNRQASEFIFRENNAPGRVPADTIDLHGQYVEEAEDILETRIREAQRQGQSHLHVVVGRGNHSPGHVQKIKPRVEQVCRDLGLQYQTENNEGRIYINLQGGPPGGGGYPQQQQPQYQGGYPGQQQYGGAQGPQGDEVEKLVTSCLPRFLKHCCTIM